MATKKSGFSLVELSIVLVILGLLVGGVLSGQSLIKAAQLRSVSSEYSNYLAAINSFRDKYFNVPGDGNNATAFFGYKGGVGCNNLSGTALTTPGTCDGNLDGSISMGGSSVTAEAFQVWRQLAFAGLVNGTYTGGYSTVKTGMFGFSHVGENVPSSKYANNTWVVNGYNTGTGWRNDFTLGQDSSGTLGPFPGAGTIPADAWNIDTKLDDGVPATGSVQWQNVYASCVTGSAPNQVYNFANSSAVCGVLFKLN